MIHTLLSGLYVNLYSRLVHYVGCKEVIYTQDSILRFETDVSRRSVTNENYSVVTAVKEDIAVNYRREYLQSLSCRRRGLLSTLSLTVQTVTLYSLPGVNPTNVTFVSVSSTIRSFVVLFSSLILNR